MGYLSETTRRRIAAVILVLGVIVAILAITDTAVFEDAPTESERVAGTVEDFFQAATGGDFGRNCELLSDEAQSTVRAGGARVVGAEEEPPSCSESLEGVLGESFSDVQVKVKSVSISGNRARVETAIKPAGEPSQFRTILLEMSEDGGWLISEFG
ncbi:MAG: hypothetical protein M3355_03495 [Actinomycetota bacterium]|nr:hypothetical protein [Actinomycetota bacterium]